MRSSIKDPRPVTIYPMEAYAFSQRVLEWFDRHGRKDLPWQVERNPYRVWVSEIMLQQTQVTTVIPYFNRFMSRFPDVSRLADAELVDVTDHWAGLGYYARARHLHLAAQALINQHAGEFPSSLDAIQSLPGIGRSTAGAILSLGMNQRGAILDGNVKRVLCRFAGIEGWPGATVITRQLWELSESLTPTLRVADYNQAMMDLGAMVCTRNKPACENCPLKLDCVALATGRTRMIPTPKPRRDMPSRQRFLLVMRNPNNEIFFETRPPTGIWANLKSFPEFESLDDLEDWCSHQGYPTQRMTVLPQRRHTFSHYHLDFTAVICPVHIHNAVTENLQSGWFTPKDVRSLPAPIRTLLTELDPQTNPSP